MPAGSDGGAEGRWVSASDLADYAYCPRSHYYQHHPPPAGRSPRSLRSSEYGHRYHRRQLTAVGKREDQARGWVIVAATAAAVLAVMVLVTVVGGWRP